MIKEAIGIRDKTEEIRSQYDRERKKKSKDESINERRNEGMKTEGREVRPVSS